MEHFNELEECYWHQLLRELLIEYVTLLTNPGSSTLSKSTTPARAAPASAAPAPAAGEGGGAGGGDGGGDADADADADADGDGDGEIEEDVGAGEEDAAGAKPALKGERQGAGKGP